MATPRVTPVKLRTAKLWQCYGAMWKKCYGAMLRAMLCPQCSGLHSWRSREPQSSLAWPDEPEEIHRAPDGSFVVNKHVAPCLGRCIQCLQLRANEPVPSTPPTASPLHLSVFTAAPRPLPSDRAALWPKHAPASICSFALASYWLFLKQHNQNAETELLLRCTQCCCSITSQELRLDSLSSSEESRQLIQRCWKRKLRVRKTALY